jgi:hypothetical protein
MSTMLKQWLLLSNLQCAKSLRFLLQRSARQAICGQRRTMNQIWCGRLLSAEVLRLTKNNSTLCLQQEQAAEGPLVIDQSAMNPAFKWVCRHDHPASAAREGRAVAVRVSEQVSAARISRRALEEGRWEPHSGCITAPWPHNLGPVLISKEKGNTISYLLVRIVTILCLSLLP